MSVETGKPIARVVVDPYSGIRLGIAVLNLMASVMILTYIFILNR